MTKEECAGRGRKQPVIGLLQREGKFEARTIPTTGSKVLCGIVRERVNKHAEIMTDELAAYKNLDKTGYKHEDHKP